MALPGLRQHAEFAGEVHHLKFRSHSGSDEEQNLITLCAECHEQMHRVADYRKARLR
jgi:5-methylcytosine-specific restriction endonuclease McrA